MEPRTCISSGPAPFLTGSPPLQGFSFKSGRKSQFRSEAEHKTENSISHRILPTLSHLTFLPLQLSWKQTVSTPMLAAFFTLPKGDLPDNGPAMCTARQNCLKKNKPPHPDGITLPSVQLNTK